MIDKMLEGAGLFDWFSPMATVIGTALRGGGYRFLIPRDGCPLSGNDIARLLRQSGVKSWGKIVHGSTLMISVRNEDAQRAYQILDSAGIPVENPPENRTLQRTRKAQGRRRSGGVFGVFDIFE